MQTADRADHAVLFFLILVFTFDSRTFWLCSQISVQLYFGVFVYGKAALARYVTVIDFAREPPFSPKYAQVKVF